MIEIVKVYADNPDLASIQSKDVIDISFTQTDATASGYSASIEVNYQGTNQVVVLPQTLENLKPGYIYYTPLYVENINYDTWKTRINKTFEELT